MKFKNSIAALLIFVMLFAITGCTKLQSQIKDFKAETLGLSRTFSVYDDFGNITMTVNGENTDIQPSDVENVLLITIDGSTWQHVGSSMVAAEKGIENIVDTYDLKTEIDTTDNASLFTGLDRKINNFMAGMAGLDRVLVVKNQSGVIVGVYEGDNVYVEDSSLPNTTKILIDGKRLHIYRSDFEIFEQKMLQ